MNFTFLVPGTGNFHCGSCLRDIWLARELIRRGHPVTILPLYLPLVHDLEGDLEGMEHHHPILLGGLSLYLKHRFKLFRPCPGFITRCLNRPFLLRLLSRFSGATKASKLGELTLSMLSGRDGHLRSEFEQLSAWLESQPAPDIFVLSNALLSSIAPLLSKFNKPILCTLQGEDHYIESLKPEHGAEVWQLIAKNGQFIDTWLPVSNFHRDKILRQMPEIRSKCQLLYNGIPLETTPPETSSVPTLGYMARLTPDKGLDLLLEAFETLSETHPDLRLELIGAQTPHDKIHLDHLLRARTHLTARIRVFPNPGRQQKFERMKRWNVMSVPTLYEESFGLYLLEAWQFGIPVVQPRHGAFPELLETTGGGLLCRPNDAVDLATHISRLLAQPELARQLGRSGQTAVSDYFSIAKMADDFLRICNSTLEAKSTP